jgi:hypothetical protein
MSGPLLPGHQDTLRRYTSTCKHTHIYLLKHGPVAGDELAAGLVGDLRGEGARIADVAQQLRLFEVLSLVVCWLVSAVYI